MVRHFASLALSISIVATANGQPATSPATPPATAPAATKPAAKPATQPVVQTPITVDEFIAALIKQTETFDAGATSFDLLRPHPLVARLPKGSEAAIAAKMDDKFTGDPQKDIYIRYHLVWPMIHPSEKPLNGDIFVKIAKLLPDKIPFQKRDDDRYEPPDIGEKYRQLMGKTGITTGFPPFERYYHAPESFQYMDAARRKEAEAAYAEAKQLEGKFKRIIDQAARNYNMRVGKTPWMLRQVRGEMLYGMVASGEPAMLDAVINLIGRQAKESSPLASDSIAFFNAAYFDGWLSQYTPEKLKSASSLLKRMVVGGDLLKANAAARDPKKDPKKTAAAEEPVLSEKAFTVITAMETGNLPKRPEKGVFDREKPELPPLAQRKVTVDTLNMQQIDDAIERAIAALENIRPPDTDLGSDSYWAMGIAAWLHQWILPGNQALANWAFLSVGEGQYEPWLQKRIGWVACFQSMSTYDRAMRLQMLSKLPGKQWQPWLKRDVDWLLDLMTEKGNFPAGVVEKNPTPYGDNANGQYAVLALFGAQEAGHEIDSKIWKQIDKYWREAQFPKGKDPKDAGGWAVRSYQSLKGNENSNDFTARVSAQMTAGGVLTLTLTERILEGPKRIDTNNKTSPELAAGIEWLDTHFDPEKIEGDNDLYYYLWTIQNVGQAIGYRKLNNVDWFRTATVALLNKQGSDGLWKGPKGPTISTSFALLYLYRARGPLAICKVQFDAGPAAAAKPADDKPATDKPGAKPGTAAPGIAVPSWNNRPNDLVNLTDEISRRLEVPTSWQIADLDQPVYQLIESATLYLTTDKAFTLTEAQVTRLREYLSVGGMLIMAPEGAPGGPALRSMQALTATLFPERELKKLDTSHPFYSLAQKVTEKIPVSVIENGVRPMVVLVEKDISRDLQADARNKRDAFSLMTNIYLYNAGLNAKHPRLLTNYIPQPQGAPSKTTLSAVRIKHGGNFDPEPGSLLQLKALLASKHATEMQVATLPAPELTAAHQLAFVTVSQDSAFTDGDAASLRKWIDGGGTLWVDAAGGKPGNATAVDALLAKLGFKPDDAKSTAEAPVTTGKTARAGGYDVTKPKLRQFTEGEIPTLRQIDVNGRAAVYVTKGDITAGLAGANTWGISGYNVQTARQLVVNSVLNMGAKK